MAKQELVFFAALVVLSCLASNTRATESPTSPPAKGSQTASSKEFAELEWTAMLPVDDVPMHRTMPMTQRMGRLTEDGGDNAAGSGMASDMGYSPADHTSSKRATQYGSFKSVATLDGRRSILSGFVVPIESDDKGDMTEFLFVPFFGACIHVPPPPPNQVVYIRLSKSIHAPEIWDAYDLKGILRTHQFDGDIASAAYTMDDAVLIKKRSRD